MPVITVIYLGSFSLVARKRRERIAIEEHQTIADVAKILRQVYGPKFAELLDREASVFLVNNVLSRDDRVLVHNDELTLTTLVGGG